MQSYGSAGIDNLLDTLQEYVRLPDGNVWGFAYVVDSLCRLAIEQGDCHGPEWISQLISIAPGKGMREFVARAHLFQ